MLRYESVWAFGGKAPRIFNFDIRYNLCFRCTAQGIETLCPLSEGPVRPIAGKYTLRTQRTET